MSLYLNGGSVFVDDDYMQTSKKLSQQSNILVQQLLNQSQWLNVIQQIIKVNLGPKLFSLYKKESADLIRALDEYEKKIQREY